MRVVLSEQAEQDLIEIGTWIARDNPERAYSFIMELRETCNGLADFPRAFAPFPLFGPTARRQTHGDYAIIYDVSDAIVTIVTVIHSARDIDRLIF